MIPLKRRFSPSGLQSHGLLAKWGSGIGNNRYDEYLHSRHLTASTDNPTKGEIGGQPAMDFDGVSLGPHGGDLAIWEASDLGVFAWINTTQTTQSYIAHKISGSNPFPGWALGLNDSGDGATNTDGRFGAWVGVTPWVTHDLGAGKIGDGQDHLVGFRLKNNFLSLIWDGEVVASDARTPSLSNSTVLTIGEHAFNATKYKGLARVRIYSPAPSFTAIKAMFNANTRHDLDRSRILYSPLAAGGATILPQIMHSNLGAGLMNGLIR